MDKILTDDEIKTINEAKKILKKINKLSAKNGNTSDFRHQIEKEAKISFDPDSIYFN